MTRFATTLLIAAAYLGATAAEDKPDKKPAVKVEFRRAETEAAEGLTEATIVGTDKKIYLHKTAELTNSDITSAKPGRDADKMPCVELTLTAQGSEKIQKLTREHRDKPLAILIDGKVISAPTIRAAISGPSVTISGNYTQEEVENLAKAINGK